MRVRRSAAAACLLGLALPGLAATTATAQETPAQARARVSEAAGALEGSTAGVRAAAQALAEVAAELPVAEADAARARGELDGAQARAATAAASAQRAEQAAQAARAEVAAASDRVQAGRDAVGRLARRSYQTGPLADVRAVFSSGSPQELLDRQSLLEQVFRSQDDSLRRLSRERLALARTQNALAAEQAVADGMRTEAARVEERSRDVAVRADTAAARVAALVARRSGALRTAQQDRAADLREYQSAQAASRALAERIRKAAAAARAARAAEAARARARARAQAAAAAAEAAAGRPTQRPAAPAPAAAPRSDGWVWPADGPLTSRFGYRRHPIYGDVRFHAGIDIGASYGSPTHAADDGVVTYAGPASGYGTLVLISHGSRDGRDITTGYAHQSALLVRAGESVTRGQQVGRVGNEGNSTGPHLHFEVRLDGDPVDPLDYVSPP